MPKKRLAFFVANTYENSPNLRELPGTLKSADLVETALEKHGFQTVRHIDRPFKEIQEALKVWRQESTQGYDPDALLFYFCGHGGIKIDKYNIDHPFCIPSDHSPFESKASQEFENVLLFSGPTSTITVGGDVIIDNTNKKLFKDKIIKTLCQVKNNQTYNALFLYRASL